jgi:hypothetical protein
MIFDLRDDSKFVHRVLGSTQKIVENELYKSLRMLKSSLNYWDGAKWHTFTDQ